MDPRPMMMEEDMGLFSDEELAHPAMHLAVSMYAHLNMLDGAHPNN